LIEYSIIDLFTIKKPVITVGLFNSIRFEIITGTTNKPVLTPLSDQQTEVYLF